MYARDLKFVLVLSLGFIAQACAGVVEEDIAGDGAESFALLGEAADSEQDIESEDVESEAIGPLEELPGCQLVADPPQLLRDSNNRWVFSALGGRQGCEQFRPRITIKIREDIPILPDEDFFSKNFSGVNNLWVIQSPCENPLNDGTYFTEVSTNAGGKVHSGRVHLDCPGPN